MGVFTAARRAARRTIRRAAESRMSAQPDGVTRCRVRCRHFDSLNFAQSHNVVADLRERLLGRAEGVVKLLEYVFVRCTSLVLGLERRVDVLVALQNDCDDPFGHVDQLPGW
jgi:hypothetical protein